MNQGYWDSLAPTFEGDVLEIAKNDKRGVLRSIVKSLGGPRKRALDFGCGTGSSTRLIAPYFSKTTGLDFSEKLLARARDLGRRKPGAPPIEYKQHDLARPTRIKELAHVSFAVNLLIHPDPDMRHAFLMNMIRNTNKNGHLVLVVPALESVLHVYHVLAQSQVEGGASRKQAAAYSESLAKDEVISIAGGIVNVGGEATKHWTLEELELFLSPSRLQIKEVKKIRYAWDEETDSPQLLKQYAKPFDWAIVARK